MLPRRLLVEKSDYFRGALNSGFVEGKENKIVLTDVDPKAFRYFIHWLYSDQLKQCEPRDLFDVWFLADRLLSENFKNLTMNLIQDHCRWDDLRVYDVKMVCQCLPPGSTLFKYCLQQVAHDWVNDELADGYKPYELEEILGISGSIAVEFAYLVQWVCEAKNKPGVQSNPSKDSGCKWHDHAHKSHEERNCPTIN